MTSSLSYPLKKVNRKKRAPRITRIPDAHIYVMNFNLVCLSVHSRHAPELSHHHLILWVRLEILRSRLGGVGYNIDMTDCIFCKIVAGEIPSYKIYEDEKYLAFLDVFPKTSYQMLVIPKAHIEWVWDVPNLGEYYEVAGKVARHIREVSGEPVRQMVYGFQVPHAHIQLRPGEKNDLDGSQAKPEKLEEWRAKYTLI